MKRRTLESARAELAKIFITLVLRDGEHRVNFRYGAEATAYYTDDLDDAVKTGHAMAVPTARCDCGRLVACPELRGLGREDLCRAPVECEPCWKAQWEKAYARRYGAFTDTEAL